MIRIKLNRDNNTISIRKVSRSIRLVKRNRKISLYKVGRPGKQGEKGDGSTVSVGTVSTGLPGTNVVITNTGDDNDAILNFTIPRGDPGDGSSPTWGAIGGDIDDQQDLINLIDTLATENDLQSHVTDVNNPHSVTKTQVGLSNVPNLDTTTAVAQTHTHSNKSVLDATTASFTTAQSTKLGSIETGAQVNNISNINATDLTDGGDSSLHYHSSDRSRSNHTGTQSADTITDGTTNKVYTSIERTKLSGISAGAEVNVNADWNAVSGDAQILNKPTIPVLPANIVQSVIAGTNVTVDNSDPENPVISASGGGGGAVDSVNGQTGVVVLDAEDVGADPEGSAAAAQGNAEDYTDTQIAAINYPVDSVNGQTGTVVLDTDDISDTASNRYTTDGDIARLANTSGVNTGDQDLTDLIQKGSIVVNVKDYGATGDGSTNDTSSIQSAITAAGVGGSIIAPKGTYIVEPDIILLENQTFQGVGWGTIFKLKDGIDVLDNIFKAESVNGVTFKNFAIDGNRENQDPSDLVSVNYGIYIAGSDNCRVENCYVYDTTGVGIHVYDSVGTVVANSESSGHRYHGFECEQDSNTVWYGNRGHNNDRHGIFVSPGEVGGTGTIGNTIYGNTFDDNGQYGIAFGIDAAGISIGLTRDNVVSHNIVTGNSHYGISLYRVDDTTVTNNIVESNGYFGLYVYRSRRNQVSDNRFHNNSQAANGSYDEILLEGNNDGTAASNNVIANNLILIDGSNKSRYGISEATSGDGPNYIYGNLIPNAGTTGKLNIQNSSTQQMVDDRTNQTIGGDKIFSTGFGVAANSVTPSAALAGVDAPFGSSSPGRIYSKYGMQLVTNDGAFDAYVREGGVQNNVATFHNDNLDMHNYEIRNANLTSGTNTYPTFNQNTTGSAATLTNARTIGTLTGDVTSAGSSFNGSANNTNVAVLANVNSNVGSFTNASITVNAKGLITAASSGSSTALVWSNVTGTTQAASINRGYIANNASLVTFTLPSTAAVGSVVRVVASGSGGWRIAQNASQSIRFGLQETTNGTGGYLQSTVITDAVELICVTANNIWTVIGSQGNITVV